MMASLSGPHDPRLQDAEVTNLYNNMSNEREPSPNQPAPPPASPSYTGIDEEEIQWVRSHPRWSEGHPLMYETRVRTPWHSVLFATTSKKGIHYGTMECSKSQRRQKQNRNILNISHETSGRQYAGTASCWRSLKPKRPKIGGTLKWEEATDLIFCETTEKECSNKELRELIKDERSIVNLIGAMLWSAENLAEVMIFAINLRN